MFDKVLGARFIKFEDKKTHEPRVACVLSLASEELGQDPRNWGLNTYEQFIHKSEYNNNYAFCETLREGDYIRFFRDRNGYITEIEKK